MKRILLFIFIFIFVSIYSIYSQSNESLSEKNIIESNVYLYHKYWINGEYEKMIDLLSSMAIQNIVDGIKKVDKQYPEGETLKNIEIYYKMPLSEISNKNIVLFVYQNIVKNTPMKDIVDVKIKNSIIVGNRAVVRYSFVFIDGRIIDPGSMKLIKEKDLWKILN